MLITWGKVGVDLDVPGLPEAVAPLHDSTRLLLLLMVMVVLLRLLLMLMLGQRRRRPGCRPPQLGKVVQVVHLSGGVTPDLSGQLLEVVDRSPVDPVQEQVRG